MQRGLWGLAFGLFVLAGDLAEIKAATTIELLNTIKAVGHNGEGNVAAQKAVRELSQQGPAILPELLPAFEGANPLAVNWLRGAFEAVAGRAVREGEKLPVAELEAFVRDRSGNPRARRLAYEWLSKVDTTAPDRLIPGMLTDPSPEFRRDAVARLIEEAEPLDLEKDREAAVRIYREALRGATDKDQVDSIIEPLRKMEEKIDLQQHFGFLTEWSIIGPFNNKEGVGFAETYAPEERIDLKGSYKGQLDEVKWKPINTEDEYGMVDIAKDVGPYKGAVMYITNEFSSADRQEVELRLGTPNAWKLWVNGRLVFSREEYHRGTRFDQYRIPATFEPGANRLLLKLCQNEQEENWAQDYKFQFRVCDGTGAAVLPVSSKTAAND